MSKEKIKFGSKEWDQFRAEKKIKIEQNVKAKRERFEQKKAEHKRKLKEKREAI